MRHHAALAPITGSDRLVSVSVGPAGEAVALWTDAPGVTALASTDESGEGFDVGPMEGPAASVVVTVQQTTRRTYAVQVPDFRGTSPVAQPLPNGRVLIAGAWAEWRPERPDLNATIYASDGTAEVTACIGDGIQNVVATADGAVWVAYCDMGIFGNNGWGDYPAPKPIGSTGLVRFSPRLEVEWEFPGDRLFEPRDRRQESIDDCEAITLAGDTLWAYYYSDYPVVRLDQGQVRAWAPDKPAAPAATGIQALATDGRRVALAGGYTGQEDRVVVARLEDQWVLERKVRLVLPDGSRLPSGTKIQGFADMLHVFAGREWYQVRLDEL